jgi:hypothetical protein
VLQSFGEGACDANRTSGNLRFSAACPLRDEKFLMKRSASSIVTASHSILANVE